MRRLKYVRRLVKTYLYDLQNRCIFEMSKKPLTDVSLIKVFIRRLKYVLRCLDETSIKNVK